MSWIKINRNGSEFYQCSAMNHTGLVQAVSTRIDGNMALHTGDDPEAVVQHRERFLAGLDLSLDCLVAAVQVHGTRVRVVGSQDVGSGAREWGTAIPDTDALITAEPGAILAIFTADCYPIFVYDPTPPAIGVIHAGWRGTLAGITRLTLKTMNTRFGTDPWDCLVTLGPAICGSCFPVNQEVAEAFSKIHPEAVNQDGEEYKVNLADYNQWLLEEAGVDRQRIFQSKLCTVCQPDDFFSFRAQRSTGGRMMGIIALK